MGKKVKKATKKFLKNNKHKLHANKRKQHSSKRRQTQQQQPQLERKDDIQEKPYQQQLEETIDQQLGLQMPEEVDVDELLDGFQFQGDEKILDGEQEDDDDDDDMHNHAEELEKLKEIDPEFYEHLKKDAAELLEFNDTDQADEEEDETQGSNVINMETLDRLQINVCQKRSLRSLKKLIVLYTKACRMGDSDDDEKMVAEQSRDVINDSDVFHRLMQSCLSEFKLHEVFLHHLQLDVDTNAANPGIKKSKQFPKFKRYIQGFLGNTLHMMQQDVATGCQDQSLIMYIMHSLQPFVRHGFVQPFKRLGNRLMRLLIDLTIRPPENDSKVAIESFVLLRDLVVSNPKDLLRECLKYFYLTFIRSKASTSPMHILRDLHMQCMVELYSLDPQTSYECVFVYIRQLALHLRNAVHQPTKANRAAVYNAKFLSSLRVWAAVISANGSDEDQRSESLKQELESLRYPLIQVIAGVIELFPSKYFIPLRLHCIRMLLQLQEHSKCFVSIATHVFRTLFILPDKGEVQQGENQDVELYGMVRASSSLGSSQRYYDVIMEECVEILREFYTMYSYSISFPELVIGTMKMLSSITKDWKKGKKRAISIQKSIQDLQTVLRMNAEWIERKRRGVDFTPKDLDKISAFSSLLKKVEESPLKKFGSKAPKKQSKIASKKQSKITPKKRKTADPPSESVEDIAQSIPVQKKAKLNLEQSLLQGEDVIENFTL